MRENVSNHGTQMLLQATLFSRLGLPHMANVHCELLLDCYYGACPVDERIRAIGRRAFTMSSGGRYDEAIATIEGIDAEIHKSLKYHQYLVLCTGVIKFKRAIRRYALGPPRISSRKLMLQQIQLDSMRTFAQYSQTPARCGPLVNAPRP